MTAPTTALALELVRMACTAPSVHNTQPWTWRVSDDARTIELYADRTRQLPGTDPSGRDLAISCGAALHHLDVAARAFGLVPKIATLPDRNDPDLFARVHLSPGETTEHAVEALAALENRETDRRGFTDWEIPTSRLERLADYASGTGVHVVALTDPRARHRAEELIEQARVIQLEQDGVSAELDQWTGRPGADGIPPHVAQPHAQPDTAPMPLDRFSRRPSAADADPDSDAPERSDALMVICTGADDTAAWLRTGWALSTLWVRATLDGLGVVPQSQVIEVQRTRRRLRRDVFDDMARPQMVVRVGWHATTRPYLERTPRRGLDSVLLP